VKKLQSGLTDIMTLDEKAIAVNDRLTVLRTSQRHPTKVSYPESRERLILGNLLSVAIKFTSTHTIVEDKNAFLFCKQFNWKTYFFPIGRREIGVG
jgi:hypothetical protein